MYMFKLTICTKIGKKNLVKPQISFGQHAIWSTGIPP